MSTLVARIPMQLFKKIGTDGYAQVLYATVPLAEKCAVVKNNMIEQHSNIRADGSGTRGYAYEWVAANRILVPPTTKVAFSDMIVIMGYKLRVKDIWPQTDIWGVLDHYELQAEAWQ